VNSNQYLAKVNGIQTSPQVSSSNENQASYNNAQVKQGEPSDVKNSSGMHHESMSKTHAMAAFGDMS
tara:strand:+ start:94 stop:294 length:201 start_codon:yes stop_codon:yes gene_type:complete